MRYLLTILATLAVLALAALVFPYTGLYNVSAAAGHSGFTRWYLHTLTEHSVKAHAGARPTPTVLGDSAAVQRGGVAYRAMCQGCHGAPGHDRSVAGEGLTPTPPSLAEEAPEWSEGELFWIVEQGIKMAGMPAYGKTHTPEELAEIVAFVKRLPELTPGQYEALSAPATPPPDSTTAGASGTVHVHSDGHAHVH